MWQWHYNCLCTVKGWRLTSERDHCGYRVFPLGVKTWLRTYNWHTVVLFCKFYWLRTATQFGRLLTRNCKCHRKSSCCCLVVLACQWPNNWRHMRPMPNFTQRPPPLTGPAPFCRATLCMCCPSCCVVGCLSVTFVYCVETAQDTAIVPWHSNRKQCPSFRMVPFSIMLNDPWPRIQDQAGVATPLSIRRWVSQKRWKIRNTVEYGLTHTILKGIV